MADFINENVGLFYAKDKFENILLINEITEHNKDIDLICPICGTQVRPRAINSDKVSPHFYHVTATEHSTESVLHWWYKNSYITKGDTFKVGRYEYKCKDVIIEKTYNTAYGDYKPDVTIITESGEIILFEYNYANKKNANDYEEKWIELGHTVVEINIKDLIKTGIIDFKPLFINGIVLGSSKSKRYGIIEKHVSEQQIKDIRRIKYLNGFLRDLYMYKNDRLSIDDLTIIIDDMNVKDKKFLPKILSGLKCQNIINDYAENKREQIIKMLKSESYDELNLSDEMVSLVYIGNAISCKYIKVDCYQYEILFIDFEKIKEDFNSLNTKIKFDKMKHEKLKEIEKRYKVKFTNYHSGLKLYDYKNTWIYHTSIDDYIEKYIDINDKISEYERYIIDECELDTDERLSWFRDKEAFELEQKRIRKEKIEYEKSMKEIAKKDNITYDELLSYIKFVSSCDNKLEIVLKGRSVRVMKTKIIVRFGSRTLQCKTKDYASMLKIVEKILNIN